MRNSVALFKSLTLVGLALAFTVSMAEAKKKKPVELPDCENVEMVEPCAEKDPTGSDDGSTAKPKTTAKAASASDAPLSPDLSPTTDASSVQASTTNTGDEAEEIDTSEWYIGTKPDQPYDIPLVDRSKMDPKFDRQEVAYDGKEPVGSIVVDIDRKFLYFIESEGRAIRYGIGVGRLGFSWRGNAIIGRKGVWPHWTPTDSMRKVLPNLPVGMDGGLDSPLGARALYLYQDGRDILFRIHGTNEPWSIGEKVSSGCVRLLNEDVADLYERAKVGTQVFVRNSKHGTGIKTSPSDVSG